MKNPLENLHQTLGIGLVVGLVILILGRIQSGAGLNVAFWTDLFRWAHVIAGVLWIGILYYFNFVQMPTMPKIPAEQRPAISKFIAPEALFWFRYAALATVVFGLITAMLGGYLSALWTFGIGGGGARFTMIGIGMWMALIMAFNVWFVIWPNQQKALGLVEVDADTRTKAARTAMLFSRFNTMFSVGMLYAMVAAKGV
jgi:uncharacterized membrane protein